MFKIIKVIPKCPILNGTELQKYQIYRTFLSQAYYCEELWNHRLNTPVLRKVNLEELYQDLDQRFQRTKQLNAIDVDIFANAIQDESYCDELLDIVHKLRLTADTGYMLSSTCHAVVRVLLQFQRPEELLNILDDRLNYGIFLDYYTANILMDTFWKSKQFAHGARVASQLMLQEELDHPLSCNFGLLHCFNYLLKPEGWPELVPSPEPEDEVKIRVKYLRNPYDDEHFDLRDPKKILGKTLAMISKNKDDPLHQSFYILGMGLFGKTDEVRKVCANLKGKEICLYKEILNFLPENSEVRNVINELRTESINVGDILVNNVEKTHQKTSEKDITGQCQTFEQWEQDRIRAMQEQQLRLSTAKRLENITDIQNTLKEKEERLWFFDKEEQIDLRIDAKKVFYPKRWFGRQKKPKKVDEGYVPPEVHNKQIGGSQVG